VKKMLGILLTDTVRVVAASSTSSMVRSGRGVVLEHAAGAVDGDVPRAAGW
jgi:hypothetical protein